MNWIVLFFWPNALEGDPPHVFACVASGREDAERQCKSYDPDAEVVWVHEGTDVKEAKREWAAGHFNYF